MTLTKSNRYYLRPEERNWVLETTSILLRDNAHRIEKRDVTQGFRCITSHWEGAVEGCYAKNFGSEECGKHAGKWGLLLIEHLSDEFEDLIFAEEQEYDDIDIVCDLLCYEGKPSALEWMFNEQDPKHMAYSIDELRTRTEKQEIIQQIDIADVMNIVYEGMEAEFAEAGLSSGKLS